jgi:Protein of unknown function (DUF1566)
MKIRCVLAILLMATPFGNSIAGCYGRTETQSQNRFVLLGGEALDTKTGLIWQRCSLGMKWDSKRGCRGEATPIGLHEATKKAGELSGKWRVPSGPELEGLVDRSCGSPVVDISVFPDIKKDEDGQADYWTTNRVGMAGLYYFFDLISGQADGHTPGFELLVRLVRDKNSSE